MESIKILIENWPEPSILAQYTPVFIAGVALIVSLYSAYLSRRSFNLSSRPYVWASSYGVIDQSKNCIIPVPQQLAYRIKNTPAKVKESNVIIYLGSEEIFAHEETDYVKFPDESSEWFFSIGEKEFTEIMKKYKSSSDKLFRNVLVKYVSLSGGKVFEYSLKQEFIEVENNWKDTESQAC